MPTNDFSDKNDEASLRADFSASNPVLVEVTRGPIVE